MAAVTELATAVGTRAACLALWVPRGSYYRDRRSGPSRIRTAPRPSSVRALAAAERETILAYLHHERFQDRSPAAVMQPCSMKGSITAPSALCTACWLLRENPANAATI
jgi:hypothetical protein